MEFIEFKKLDDILSTTYKYNLIDNYVAIQISICKIYAIFYINPKYRRVVLQKFLEQPIYIGSLKTIYTPDEDFKTLINTIDNSKNIVYYKQILANYEQIYYSNMFNKLFIISFI